MNNPLYSSVFTLFIFWFIALYLVSGENVLLFPLDMMWALVLIVVGVVFGGGGVIAWRLIDLSLTRKDLQSSERRGCTLSIGEQRSLVPVATGKVPGGLFDKALDFDAYAKKFPKHADLLMAAARVMCAEPNLPASPIKGGHGGATLIAHSMNVTRVIQKLLPTWKYEGHKNKKGEIAFPMIDTTKAFHSFSNNDPLPILAAFVHDIGKVFCYKLMPDGSVQEVKENHDTEGARLLRRLPELWELPPEDVRLLLMAVGFYHKIGDLPCSEWMNDRGRSLTELLYRADVETGKLESGAARTTSRETASREAPAAPAAAPAATQQRAEPSMQSQGNPVRQSGEPTLSSDAGPELDAESQKAFEQFAQLIIETNRINGRDSKVRVGYKYGDWLYISDALLRREISSRDRIDITGEQPGNAIHPWTLALMRALETKGLLKKTLDDMEFSAKSALFDTDDGLGHKMRFVMIVRVSGFRQLERLENCKTEPRVERCSWGNTRALNKNKARDAVAEDAPVPDAVQEDDIPDPSSDPAETVPGPDESGMSLEELQAFALTETDPASYGEEDVSEASFDAMDGADPSAMSGTTEGAGASDDGAFKPSVAASWGESDASSGWETENDLLSEGRAEDGAQNGAFDLKKTLEEAATALNGPTFKQKKMGDKTCAFFEVDEVIQFYDLSEEDLHGVPRLLGGDSGKEFFYVEMKV